MAHPVAPQMAHPVAPQMAHPSQQGASPPYLSSTTQYEKPPPYETNCKL